MSVDVSTEIVIDRPVADVAAFAADPANAPRWYENIASVSWVTEPTIEQGARATFSARFMGRTMTYTYELVDVVPGQRLVMRTAEGPFPMETTYEWSAEGGRTRMRLRNRGEPSGFAALAQPLLSMAMKRANTKDLRALKRVLEQGG